jgi:hypothetical protein
MRGGGGAGRLTGASSVNTLDEDLTRLDILLMSSRSGVLPVVAMTSGSWIPGLAAFFGEPAEVAEAADDEVRTKAAATDCPRVDKNVEAPEEIPGPVTKDFASENVLVNRDSSRTGVE